MLSDMTKELIDGMGGIGVNGNNNLLLRKRGKQNSPKKYTLIND